MGWYVKFVFYTYGLYKTNINSVWHGKQEKYQLYETIGGRFVSEFGIESLPNIETVKYFAPNPADQHSHSRVLDFHNKFDGQERRLASYLSENFRPVGDLEVRIRSYHQSILNANDYHPFIVLHPHHADCSG